MTTDLQTLLADVQNLLDTETEGFELFGDITAITTPAELAEQLWGIIDVVVTTNRIACRAWMRCLPGTY